MLQSLCFLVEVQDLIILCCLVMVVYWSVWAVGSVTVAIKSPQPTDPKQTAIKDYSFTPTGTQLQRPLACPHLPGNKECAAQASSPWTCREGLQTWLLRGWPAGEENTQVRGLFPHTLSRNTRKWWLWLHANVVTLKCLRRNSKRGRGVCWRLT